MEQIEVILSIAGAALTFLLTAVTFIIKFINAAKARNIGKMKEVVEEAVVYAEDLKGRYCELSGNIKKSVALERIENKCASEKLKFDKDTAVTLIENVLKLTKNVNAREKDLNDAA